MLSCGLCFSVSLFLSLLALCPCRVLLLTRARAVSLSLCPPAAHHRRGVSLSGGLQSVSYSPERVVGSPPIYIYIYIYIYTYIYMYIYIYIYIKFQYNCTLFFGALFLVETPKNTCLLGCLHFSFFCKFCVDG